MKNLTCPYCNTQMQFFAHEDLQLGKTGWVLGDLPNLIAGALGVDIYICPTCRKLDFFATDEKAKETDELPKKTCPQCGTVHDFDYPKCPHCKYDYYKN